MSELRALKKNLDSRFSSSALRKILTKDNNPSKIKSLYLKFYTDKKLDTSKPLTEIFKDLRTTKLSKNKLALYDKFVREDKTPPDYITSIKEIVKSINIPNPENFMEKLSYLQESSEWVNKIDSIKIPTTTEEEEEEEKAEEQPTKEEDLDIIIEEKFPFKEVEEALEETKPKLRKPKTYKPKPEELSKTKSLPPQQSLPKKQDKPKAKQPSATTSKPPPATMTEPLTPRQEIPSIESAKAKRVAAEEKLQETIEGIPVPDMADPVPQPIKLTTTKPKPKVVETEVKTGLEDIPSKIDLIPPEKLSSEFKSAKELEADINYFFKTFPKQLEKIKKTYVKAKKTPEYLKRTHKRIVAILRAGAKESKEKVGVIIEGSEFIKDKLREIYLEEISKGLTAEDLIMNVEKEASKDKEDIGFYEIKKGPSGKEHSQREPIYAKVPVGDEFNPKKEFTKKPARLNTLPTEYRSRFTYENTLNENNPFVRPQSRIQLRKLY